MRSILLVLTLALASAAAAEQRAYTTECATAACDLDAGTTIGGAAVQSGVDDDVPESGDFGAAADLDADGSLSSSAMCSNPGAPCLTMANPGNSCDDQCPVAYPGSACNTIAHWIIKFDTDESETGLNGELERSSDCTEVSPTGFEGWLCPCVR